jgi:hypothetical protein
MLLRTEMPPQWNITGWAVEHETQTYPTFGEMSSIGMCLQPSKAQESIYRPLIDDYAAKNRQYYCRSPCNNGGEIRPFRV